MEPLGRLGQIGFALAILITAISRGKTELTIAPQPEADHPAIADPVAVNAEFPPAMQGISFQSGDAKLNGLVYIADGLGPHPTVLLLHGYPGNERSLDLAQALRRAGTNVVYFNYRGTWGSGGEFSVAHALEDVAHVVSRARDPEWAATYRGDPNRVAIIGHSFGGFLGAMTMAKDESLPCYAHLAGANLGAMYLRARNDSAYREAFVALFGQEMDPVGGPINGDVDSIVEHGIRNAETYALPSQAPGLASRPLLVVAGSRDERTPKEVHHDPLVSALRSAGADRLTEVVFDDDHVFSAHRVELAIRLVNWQRSECWQ